MFESLKIAVVGSFIEEEIAKLEKSLATVADKVKTAEPKLAADVQLELVKAKAIFAKYKPNAESEVAMVKAEIRAAEQAVVAEVIKLEAAAKAEAEKLEAAAKVEVAKVKTKVKAAATAVKAKLKKK